jgi:hypothetical protein
MIFSITNLRKSVSIFNPLKRSPNPTNARSSLVLGNVSDRGRAAVVVALVEEEAAGAVPAVINFVLKVGLCPGAASGKEFNRGALPGADKEAANAVVCQGCQGSVFMNLKTGINSTGECSSYAVYPC